MDPNERAVPAGPGGAVNQQAHARGSAAIYQAGRDQHLHYVDGAHHRRRAAPGPIGAECPYPGLTAFEPAQAEWFFGRDELVADLVARLDRRIRAGGPQVVVAPSGAGKSSLLRAGLLAKLDTGALPSSQRWPKLLFTPTSHPVRALAAQLAPVVRVDPVVLAGFLTAQPDQCAALLARALQDDEGSGPARFVVVVDQFEELFTLCSDDRERRAFIDLLARLAGARSESDPNPVGLVVLGLRADFYAPCADHPALRAALQDAPLVVGPMSTGELREAILFPARNVGLDVEPGLVELLLHDLGATRPDNGAVYEAGRLPLLAHALRVSWQQRHGSTLTVHGYQQAGGIRHAIATTAEHVFAALDEPCRQAARRMLPRLVLVREDTADAARPVAFPALVAGLPDQAAAHHVVDRFTDARLLTSDRDTVRISHEALLHVWPRLREWLDADRDWLRARQQLADDALSWERAARDPSLLYRGTRLAIFRQRAAEAPGSGADVEPGAVAFIDASWRQERRGARVRRRVIATLAVLLVVAAAGGGVAAWQSRVATQQRDLLASKSAGQTADRIRLTEPTPATRLALAARHVADTPEARTSLLNSARVPHDAVLAGHTDVVGPLDHNPERHLLASAGEDGAVRLWDLADPAGARAAAVLRTDERTDVAFSPDGRLLVAGMTGDGQQLWDVTDPDHPTALATLPVARGALAFTRDGRSLASVNKHDLSVWDVTDPRRPVRTGMALVGALAVMSASISADGRTLAAAIGPPPGHDQEDYSVRLWDLADRGIPAVLTTLTGTHAFAVAFSPNAPLLAVGGNGVGASLWDVGNPAEPTKVESTRAMALSGIGTVAALAFAPDGGTLAVGVSGDSVSGNRVELVDVTDPSAGRTSATYPVPTPINAVVFGDDPSTTFSTGHENVIRAWRPAPDARLAKATTLGVMPHDWAYTPNSRVLALAAEPRGTGFQLWHTTGSGDARPGGVLPSSEFDAEVIAVTDRTLLVGSKNHPAQLWDVTDPDDPVRAGVLDATQRLLAGDDVVTDGRTVAAYGTDGRVHLWDVADPYRPKRLGAVPTPGRAGGLHLSGDGRTLLSIDQGGGADRGGRVEVWDLADPREPARISGFTAGQPLVSIAGSVDPGAGAHDLLAISTTTLTTGEIQLWDLDDLDDPVRADFTPGTAYSFAVSPDGRTLAVATDSTVDLWDVTDVHHPSRTTSVPAVAQAQLTFSPDGRLLVSTGRTASLDVVASDPVSELTIWDVGDQRRVVEVGTPVLATGVSALTFSPDGRTLLVDGSRGARGAAWLLDVDVDDVNRRLCDAVGGTPLTEDEWRRYLPGIPYDPPCR